LQYARHIRLLVVQVDASVLSGLSAQTLLHDLGLVGVAVILFAETGLLLGFFLPGDSLLFVAGYATVSGNSLPGHFTLPMAGLLVVAPVAAILGAQVGFEIGRRAGPRLFARPDSRLFKSAYVDKTGEVFTRFGPGRAVVLARFVPIVRTFLNPMAGTVGMRVRDFAVWNVVGALLWTIGLVLLGHAIGNVGFVRRNIEVLALAVVLLSILPLVVGLLRHRLRRS
jgi:membrane-associated protein